jgi:hypothetical protein
MQADSVFQDFKAIILKKKDTSKKRLGSGRAIPTMNSVLEFGEAPIRIPAGIML